MKILFIILGIFLLIQSIVLYFVRRHYRSKLYSLQAARSTSPKDLQQLATQIAHEIGSGSLREYVKLTGRVQCDTPLTSELKQMPCVYYTMQVLREYEELVIEQAQDGKTKEETRRSSETVSQNSQSVPFWVQDRSGRLRVEPEGAAIETVKVLDEFRPERGQGGTLSFGGFSLNIGSLSNSRQQTLGYRYQEEILPLDRSVLVVALASDHTGEVVLHKPLKKGQKFIISLKPEEVLTQDTRNAVAYSFYGLLASVIVGFLFLILSLITR